MAYKLKTNKRFEKDLANIYEYIAENYGSITADGFVDKVDIKVRLLLQYPEFGRPSSQKYPIRKLNIAKYNKLYYRLVNNQIILIRILDDRKDPRKNKYE
jgi:plasmid stabilization system protein ParE